MLICFSGLLSIALGRGLLELVRRYDRLIIWLLVGGFLAGMFLLSMFFFAKYSAVTSTQNISLSDVYSGSE